MSNAIGSSRESNPSRRICHLRAVPLGHVADNVLHNYVRSKDGYEFDDTLTIEGVTPLRHSHAMSSRGSRDTLSIREKFADYFMTPEGSLPWQHSKV